MYGLCEQNSKFHNITAGGTAALYCHAIALIVNMTYGTNARSEGNNHAVVEKRQTPAL
jgi:hypothetical protein